MDRTLIDQYESGGEKLALAIRGLTPEDLLTVSASDAGAGKWSIQQVVLHIADSDQVMPDRMKQIIAEDNPTLISFDETKWSKDLHYHDQSIQDAITIADLTRKQMARIVRKLP